MKKYGGKGISVCAFIGDECSDAEKGRIVRVSLICCMLVLNHY